MLFILPLGIVLYFYDKKINKQNIEIFDAYVNKIIKSDLDEKDKILKIDEMYYENGYVSVRQTEEELIFEKKHFNLGVLFIYFGIFTYFGLIFFYIYYKFFLKPQQLHVDLKSSSELS